MKGQRVDLSRLPDPCTSAEESVDLLAEVRKRNIQTTHPAPCHVSDPAAQRATCLDSESIMVAMPAARRWLVRVLAERVVELRRERRKQLQDTSDKDGSRHGHDGRDEGKQKRES